MNAFIQYVATYWQPLLILLMGVGLLTFVGYINWYKQTKQSVVGWVARQVFRNGFRSDVSADNLFMTITSFLLALGGIWIVVAVLYLTA